MVVGLTAGVVATILSVLVGVTAGYLGGGWDESAVRAVQRVPGDPGAAADHHRGVHLRRTPATSIVALVIGLTSWAWGARVLRAQTLSLRRRDYVEAARATGETDLADHRCSRSCRT